LCWADEDKRRWRGKKWGRKVYGTLHTPEIVPGKSVLTAQSLLHLLYGDYHEYGHEHSVSFQVSDRSLPPFLRALETIPVWQNKVVQPGAVGLAIQLPLAEINVELASELATLEPHGKGFPRPRFIAFDAPVELAYPDHANPVHLYLRLTESASEPDNHHRLFITGHSLGHLAPLVRPDSRIDLVYELVLDARQKRFFTPHVLVVDLRLSSRNPT
jgi:hypothetical protein